MLRSVESAAPTVGLAVVNPASGPGTVRSAEYAAQIASARSKGIIVLGYVSSAYTGRSLAAVKDDIDRYYRWYPAIDGIFVDELSSDCGNRDGYYKPLYEIG